MKREKDIAVLLLGAGVGSFAACRAFYGDYGICPSVMDEVFPPFFHRTPCAREIKIPHLSSMQDSLLLRVLEDYVTDAEKRGARRFFLLPAADFAQEFVQRQEEALSRLFLLPYRNLSRLPASKEMPFGLPTGALTLFADGDGGVWPVYASVLCRDASGEAAAYLTSPLPGGLARTVKALAQSGAGGIFSADVYGEGEAARCGPFTANLSRVAFFADAADVSFAELLIRRYIAFTVLPPMEQTEKGIYRLLSRRGLCAAVKGSEGEKEVLSLLARGWDIGLFDKIRRER